MPLHFLGSIAETTSISLNTVFYCTCLVGLLLVFKTVWVEGRKCTWERDWAGKFLIIIAPPSPLVYALLDHLVNLAHPPQVLYLPPIPSPLPQELLTILHAIRLSAATKSPHAVPVSTATDVDETAAETKETNQEQESSIPSASLHCDPLPRSPQAIKEFIRRWAIKPPGTGDDGRRVDAIVWADEWSVDAPLKVFRTTTAGMKEEDVGDTWAGVRSDSGKKPQRQRKEQGATEWTAEEAKFFFLNNMLPFLLKAPMERSIRLVNVLGPFYSAAVPLIGSSVEEQGRAADQLLSDATNSNDNQSRQAQQQQPQTKPSKAAAKKRQATLSPIVTSGKASLRNILLWKHLQKILDALASASHNQATEFKIPARPGSEIPVPDDREEDVQGKEEEYGSVLRQRKTGAGKVEDKDKAAPPLAATSSKKITVQSNILALPVVIGFNRWGIIRPLMGFTDSYLGRAMYILLAPLIYLLTPSTKSALQSILYALSAPVLYDDEEDSIPEQTAMKKDDDKDEGGKKGKSTGKAGKGRRDGVKGGGIIRDASWIPYPFAPSWADPLASKIWDQLEVRVEAGLKAASDEGSTHAANGKGKAEL
ncbi:hypothetical protein QFC22_005827 [Naganishia vaughanmartiniae]|uniref:Uncharacterized protein n=1 Tax=Naganishia vaughanmartiniae TaxID=1424756 RepID=A0ACC2WQE5_9TREE|nr:hypothetical protein QFC22_005827 [Naganishia vaughanmartiniae]